MKVILRNSKLVFEAKKPITEINFEKGELSIVDGSEKESTSLARSVSYIPIEKNLVTNVSMKSNDGNAYYNNIGNVFMLFYDEYKNYIGSSSTKTDSRFGSLTLNIGDSVNINEFAAYFDGSGEKLADISNAKYYRIRYKEMSEIFNGSVIAQ